MSTIPTIDLNDGTRIPQLGFGVFQIEPDKTAQSVQTALEIGYRHIDTAEMYQNEAGVGQGIRDAGLDRAEVYITSKLNNGYHKPDDARRAFDATLERAARSPSPLARLAPARSGAPPVTAHELAPRPRFPRGCPTEVSRGEKLALRSFFG